MSTSEPEIDPQLIAAIEAINAEDPTANMGVEPSDPAQRDTSPTPASSEGGPGVGAAANQPSPASTPDADAADDELIATALGEDQGEPEAPGAPDPAPPAGDGQDDDEGSDDLASILAEHLGHKPTVDEIVGLISALEQPAPPPASPPYNPAPYTPQPIQPLPAGQTSPGTGQPAEPPKLAPVPIDEFMEPSVRASLEAHNRNIEAMNAQLAAAEQQRVAWEAEQQRAAEAEQQRFMANVSAGYAQAKDAFYATNPDLNTRQKVRLEKAIAQDGRVWAFIQAAATPAEGITKFYEFLSYSDDDIRSTIDASRAAEAAKRADESAKRKARASAAAGGGGAIPRDNTVIPTTREGRDKAALAVLEEAFANPQAE